MQDLSREQAETHKVLVQPALEAAATATVNVLQQLVKSTTEQVCQPELAGIITAASGHTQHMFVLLMKGNRFSGA